MYIEKSVKKKIWQRIKDKIKPSTISKLDKLTKFKGDKAEKKTKGLKAKFVDLFKKKNKDRAPGLEFDDNKELTYVKRLEAPNSNTSQSKQR
jgi:hypothetical protein